jgi:hypothetical protein
LHLSTERRNKPQPLQTTTVMMSRYCLKKNIIFWLSTLSAQWSLYGRTFTVQQTFSPPDAHDKIPSPSPTRGVRKYCFLVNSCCFICSVRHLWSSSTGYCQQQFFWLLSVSWLLPRPFSSRSIWDGLAFELTGGFQSSADFSMDPAGFLRLWPLQRHFLLFTWSTICFCIVIFHKSLLDIVSGHLIVNNA